MSTVSKSCSLVFISTSTGSELPVEGEHRLEYGDVVRIVRAGQLLYIVSGYTWVTFDGRDVLLAADQEMILEPGIDPVVVSALEGDACVYRLWELPPLI